MTENGSKEAEDAIGKMTVRGMAVHYGRLSDRQRALTRINMAAQDIHDGTDPELQGEIDRIYRENKETSRRAFANLQKDFDRAVFEKMLDDLKALRLDASIKREAAWRADNKIEAAHTDINDYMVTRSDYTGTMRDIITTKGIRL